MSTNTISNVSESSPVATIDPAVKPTASVADALYLDLIALIGTRLGRMIGLAFGLDKDVQPKQFIGALGKKNADAKVLETLKGWDMNWFKVYGCKCEAETVTRHEKEVAYVRECVAAGRLGVIRNKAQTLANHFATSGSLKSGEPLHLVTVVRLIVRPQLTARQMAARFSLSICDE